MRKHGTKGLGALGILALVWSTAACGSTVVVDADGDGIPDDEDDAVTPPGGGASGPGTTPACAPGSGWTEVAPWEKASDYLAVHAGWVYWTSHHTVERAPQAGGGPVEVLLAPNGDPSGIDVDDSGVYVIIDDGSVVRLEHGGGAPTTLMSDIGAGGAFSVVRVDAEHVYFKIDCGHLARIPKGNGQVQVVAETDGCFGGFALDDDAVYFVDYGDGHIGRAAKDGGPVTVLVDGAAAQASGYTGAAPGIAIDADNVYWTSGDGGFVGAVPKGGGEPTILADGLPFVQDVVAADGLVYWSDHHRVGRVATTGEGELTVTDEPGIAPMSLVIDGDFIFFTNYVANGAVLGVCR